MEIGKNERPATHPSAREWMGIEPTSPGVNRDSTALKAAGPTRRPDTPYRRDGKSIVLLEISPIGPGAAFK